MANKTFKLTRRTQASGLEVCNETPLFLQDDGEKILEKRRKELEVFVKVLNLQPIAILGKTFTFLNQATLNPNEVGETLAKAIKDWWNKKETKDAIQYWIFGGKHKVNGEFNNWSSGYLGSRWADTKLNGRKCRIAFYSRINDPHQFPPHMEEVLGKRYDYTLKIDPTL
jgi:hypothetical protein